MPIYSYHCDSCGKEFDVRESFDAPSVRDCTCGEQKTARRVIHPVGVIYKGSGFYTTDYARKSSSGTSSNGSSSSGSSSNGSPSNDSSSGSASPTGSSESSKPAAAAGSDKP